MTIIFRGGRLPAQPARPQLCLREQIAYEGGAAPRRGRSQGRFHVLLTPASHWGYDLGRALVVQAPSLMSAGTTGRALRRLAEGAIHTSRPGSPVMGVFRDESRL